MTNEKAYEILSNGLVHAPSEHEWCVAFNMAMDLLKEPGQGVAHWIQTKEKDDAEPFILWECSCCHKEFRGVVHKVSNYCLNCGCRMVEPQESEGVYAESNN